MNITHIYSRQLNSLKKSACSAGKLIVPFFLHALLLTGLQAQNSQTLYFMDRLPQSSLINPATQHHHNFHIGLPGISSFNLDARTNFVDFNDLIFRHPENDSLITFLHPDADISDFTSKLLNMNSLFKDLHLNILSFGFRVRNSFLSFNISERSSFRTDLPRDLVLLALEGNEQFLGLEADLSNSFADINYFREYSAGYSYMAGDRLSLGVRAKMLFGKAGLSFEGGTMDLFSDPDSYNTRLRSRFNMNLSMPVTLEKDEDGNINGVTPHFDREDYDQLDFVFNSRNTGFAADLGVTYNVSRPFTLFASVTDLGFINWKEDVYNFSVDGEFEFDGINLSPLFSDDDSDPLDNLLDSLRSVFNMNDVQNNPFSRRLPARVYLGGSYELTRGLSLGLLGRSEIYNGSLNQAFTLSANSSIGRWLSASLSWSVMNNSYNNLGLGLALRGGGFQLYAVSDNLNTVFYPHKARSVNVWFGLNLVFGHRPVKVTVAPEPFVAPPPPPPPPVRPEEEKPAPEPVIEPEVVEEPEVPEPVVEPEIVPEPVEPAADFYIIAASFETMQRASVRARQLRQQGYEADVLYSAPNRYRVHIHVFDNRSQALQMLERVRSQGEIPDAWLLRQERQPVPDAVPESIQPQIYFYIIAASFETMRRASQHVEILRKKGYEADVLYSAPNRYRVYSNAFENRNDALKMLENVRSRGDIPDAWLLRQ